MDDNVPKLISEPVKPYRGLGPTARRATWMLLAPEAVVIAAAEVDIQRRPAHHIRARRLRSHFFSRIHQHGCFRGLTSASSTARETPRLDEQHQRRPARLTQCGA